MRSSQDRHAPLGEWRRRKAERAPDPMTPFWEGGKDAESAPAAHAAPGRAVFTARVAGKVVARSTNVHLANNRYYFPITDCVHRHFAPSHKRWRHVRNCVTFAAGKGVAIQQQPQ
eukprot:jgi/Tetstr1/445043/TSEL_032850.t1